MYQYEWRIFDESTDRHYIKKGWHYRFTAPTWRGFWIRINTNMKEYSLRTNEYAYTIPNIRRNINARDLTSKHWSTIGYTKHGKMQIRLNPLAGY